MPKSHLPLLQVFDRQQDCTVVRRRLPHWSQAGTLTFITWRTWDSIPKPVVEAWLAERDQWLQRHGINSNADNWQGQLESLDSAHRGEFERYVSDRWHQHLDALHGECVLRRLELAQIVADSLLHFNGDRYELTDFVVMPNHVHLLAAFPDDESLLAQCDSWKHFTATQLNRALGRRGRFWQPDGFDHLVRSPEQFDYLRRYIADNPRRANLSAREFIHWSNRQSTDLTP